MDLLPKNQEQLSYLAEIYAHNKVARFSSRLTVKREKIFAYLKHNNIRDVVIGVSGGVDSAVVLGLLCQVKQMFNPRMDFNIHCYNIHFDVYDEVFDFSYIQALKSTFGNQANFSDINATESFNKLISDMFPGKKNVNKQIKAQSSYALRYQMLFTYAQALKGITFGTTNKDELDYVGWFGKSSDMVVDIQPIADWSKVEVYEAARILMVPDAIINRTPSGDLIDKSSDEENFGCTYDELSFYVDFIAKSPSKGKILASSLFLREKFEKVETLHKKNQHKYQGQTFNPIFI